MSVITALNFRNEDDELLALAEEFARMDNQVIVAARSPEKLSGARRSGLGRRFEVTGRNRCDKPLGSHAADERSDAASAQATLRGNPDRLVGSRVCAFRFRSYVQCHEGRATLVRAKPALSAQTDVDTSDRDSTALRSNRIRRKVPSHGPKRHAVRELHFRSDADSEKRP